MAETVRETPQGGRLFARKEADDQVRRTADKADNCSGGSV